MCRKGSLCAGSYVYFIEEYHPEYKNVTKYHFDDYEIL
jgi:hypothetical protein